MIIKELALYTNLIEELKEFYSQTLELALIKEDESSFAVSCGDSVLMFTLTNGIKDPFYHFAFNIPENKFKEAKDWISGKTELIKLNGEDEFDFRSWNAHSVYFYDPSGNIIELIARHNLNNASDEEFSGRSILSVSEAGLPVDDVDRFFSEVNKEFNIPQFSGDRSAFCAAGDDSGLFIIVSKGRKWFPDCCDAEIFPLLIIIRSNIEKELEFENLPYKIISSDK